MVQLFRDQSHDEPAWRVFGRAALDLVLTIPHQHLEVRMQRNPTPALTLTFLTIALGGAFLAVVGGSNLFTLVVGLIIAVGAGALAATTWRRAAPFKDSNVSTRWWQFVIAGAALVAAVIIGAGLGIDAWFAGFITAIVGVACVALGVILGVARLVTHRTPSSV